MSKGTRGFTSFDVTYAEAKYHETGDPAYIVLAIGDNPTEPPAWALYEAQVIARKAMAASVRGNDRALLGKRLDAMFREFFRRRDEYAIGDEYSPPSDSTVARAVLAHEGITPDDGNFESAQKTLVAAWRSEAEGHYVNGEGVPESPRWKRMVREWGDCNSRFPYARIGENWWMVERLQKAGSQVDASSVRKKKID